MMNTRVVLASTILAILLPKCMPTCTEKKCDTDGVWGHRGESNSEEIDDIAAYVKTMTTEWEDMIVDHGAEDVVKKYTEDTVFIQKVEGGTVRKHLNREALKTAYEEWFDTGVVRAEVTPLHEGWLADGLLYLTADIRTFDKDGNTIRDVTQFIIYRQVGCGFQTHMVVDMHDM